MNVPNTQLSLQPNQVTVLDGVAHTNPKAKDVSPEAPHGCAHRYKDSLSIRHYRGSVDKGKEEEKGLTQSH